LGDLLMAEIKAGQAGDTDKWTVEAETQKSLKANTDDAVLVLRLGVAITAMRAAQRLTLCCRDSDEPGMQRDRLWAFLLAGAYLHELRVTLQPRFPRVKELALQGGGTEAEAKEVGEVISGKSDFSKSIEKIRNELVFHFDEEAVKKWINEYDSSSVVWAEGVGDATGNVLYRASTDAVSSAILPGIDPTTDDGRQQLTGFIKQVLHATDVVMKFFERATAGYLASVGAKMKHS
jgi:hypothetical protein